MIEKTKKQKKGLVKEEDISSLLQRYSPTTVLTLLQEVSQVSDVKIDWNALVKNTSTGISNAREYQMLWRHLAYRNALIEKLVDGAEPLDDDSDLEFELEPFPAVNSESLTEAAACAKILIAFGTPSDSSIPSSSTVEAPLTINLPNAQSSKVRLENPETTWSVQGTYITIPVSVQRQPVPTPASAEGLDTNGSGNSNLSRRKRKPWSEAEDLELIAAVQKCGDRNWANILRGDFKGDRTASQLSQRWAIIRKRHGNLNVGGCTNGTQLSEDQVEATRHAMSLALDMPVNNIKAICTGGSANTNTISKAAPSTAPEGLGQAQNQSHQSYILARQTSIGAMNLTAKSQTISSKKLSAKPNFHADSIVRATAVAAGARIASRSDAESLLKAAQAKNAIHIMPAGGGPSTKPSISGSEPIHSDAHPNVRFISTKAAPSLPTYPSAMPSAPRAATVKTISPTVQHNSSSSATSSISDQSKNINSLPASEHSKQEGKTVEDIEVPKSGNGLKEEIEKDKACASGNIISDKVKREEEGTSQNPETGIRNQVSGVEMSNGLLKIETVDSDHNAVIGDKVEGRENTNDNGIKESVVEGSENASLAVVKCENRNMNEKHANVPSMVDGCSQNPGMLSNEGPVNMIEERKRMEETHAN